MAPPRLSLPGRLPAPRRPRLVAKVAVASLGIAFSLAVFMLVCLRATQVAASLGGTLSSALGGLTQLVFLLAAAAWLAALAWAVALGLPWARMGHALTDIVLAAGAVAWILPPSLAHWDLAAQATSFVVALAMVGSRIAPSRDGGQSVGGLRGPAP